MKKSNFNFFNIYYLVITAVIIVLNLIFTQLPLLNTLGYEFAAINSLILLILSALYTITFLKSVSGSSRKLFLRLIIWIFIPLIISIVNSVSTKFCSFTDGILFYILITLPSVFVGSSISFLLFFFLKKYHKVYFLTTLIILILIPIAEIYFNPQVYFYSPLIGYFPGNIYDEGLSPDIKLIFHQFLISIYFLSILYLLINNKRIVENHKKKFALALIIIPITFQFLSPFLGYTTTFCKLENRISKKIVTANTILHYDALNENEANYIALNQQYYFEKLKDELKVYPNKKIDVFVFNDNNQKKILFGAGNADVAKPWQYSVYVSIDSWENTLYHEMAHIFSAEFGRGIFKVADNFNASMIEGFAEAVDNNYNDLSLFELVSLAYQNGYKVDLNNLYSGLNFFKQNSALSYIYSGAFYKHLIDSYGIEKAKLFYKNGDFSDIFYHDFNSVVNDFVIKISSVKNIGSKAMADYYFGRTSIVQKICPRFVSDRLTKAWSNFNDSNFKEAEKLFDEVNGKTTNYSSLMGLSEIYLLNAKPDKAIKILNMSLKKFSNSPYYYNLLLKLGDLYVVKGDSDMAKSIYDFLIRENPDYYLSAISNLRLELIRKQKISEFIQAKDSLRFKILIDLNMENYNYYSFPVLIKLAEELKTDFNSFLKTFDKTLIVNSTESSYAVYILSKYILKKGDYNFGRKMASLSLRYKDGNPFYSAIQKNFEKANWLFYNSKKALQTFKYSLSN